MPSSIVTQVVSPRQDYATLVRRRLLLLFGMAVLLLISLLVDLSTGPARYGLWDVAGAVFGAGPEDPKLSAIVWSIRLPAALMALAVGASLAVAGAQMQTILNNPLASPYTLGLSAGASFGAAITLAFGVVLVPAALDYMVPINAFIVAMATAFIIYGLSLRRGAGVQTIVLLGIALVFTFNALLSMVQFLATDQAFAAVVFWTMGSLTKATWPKLAVTCAVIAATVPVFAARRWQLTALRLGDAKAASMGVPVRRLRLETLILVAMLASVPVAFVGTVGFVGLVGPHIARMLIGEDQRFLLPATALCGALIMSASSIVAKTVLPGATIPIGIVTALVGIPFFIVLILRNGKSSW
ncbi:FecCD family ABC transporter permease [Hwanghaeella sp.]|uniref:FecCD family ABC transporter permease n=1 Tax=Hwanghaeella sp. TaxID=2605943 RepID=UPI003CCC0378